MSKILYRYIFTTRGRVLLFKIRIWAFRITCGWDRLPGWRWICSCASDCADWTGPHRLPRGLRMQHFPEFSTAVPNWLGTSRRTDGAVGTQYPWVWYGLNALPVIEAPPKWSEVEKMLGSYALWCGLRKWNYFCRGELGRRPWLWWT